MSTIFDQLPYNPKKLPRELTPFYISATENEIAQMLKEVGLNSLSDLYSHIPCENLFLNYPDIGKQLNYEELVAHVTAVAKKNRTALSFLGHSLQSYQVMPIVPFVSNLRNLATAYTPYQPERSQGTLMTLWMYASSLSTLTGFEAINASMYDRSTALFEAINAATRLVRGSDTALVCESLYPQDIDVLKTLAKETNVKIVTIPINSETGTTNLERARELVEILGGKVAALVIPQVNAFGILEDVNELTDLARQNKSVAIGVIDPMLLATGGLKAPSLWGKDALGCHMFVGEGQHLAIGPNFGGPGLGIFGIRFNDKDRNSIRQTAGRFIGKALDENGNPALAMVLSTREQHIRREKATSNICSNQSFIATLAGAAILERGEEGMKKSIATAKSMCEKAVAELTKYSGVSLAFPKSPVFNEVTFELPLSASELILKASHEGIHLGVDVSLQVPEKNRDLILISFSDLHNDDHLKKLITFFAHHFEKEQTSQTLATTPSDLLRVGSVGLPSFSHLDLCQFYEKLDQQNVSPDDIIYPLGSCTMKYNPYINEYAANLPGITDLHPSAPLTDAQGSLHLLYETQELFKKITGLPGVTTQPMAGAQGELVGLKLFQAYHRDHGEADSRDMILIPRSAHGTNPASATMAGYKNIAIIEADEKGEMDLSCVTKLVTEHGKRIAGVMVTNPNTSGVFETNFKKIADLIHSVGALVYMDGANMNAIAGWIDLSKLGVDAVHNNLHKTWSIPHGGGGPGDAIVAVSEKLIPYLPGVIVVKDGNNYQITVAPKSIGNFHRHFGNFAHKMRAYTYIKALGSEGVHKMSAVAVLSARYLYSKLSKLYPSLPVGGTKAPRMHEFILTLPDETFKKIEAAGTPKSGAIARVGKLFLDFGLHAPTVAFPEVYGLMIEPTESYTKAELDRFIEVVATIKMLIEEHPEVLTTAPHFMPIIKVDEVEANKSLVLSEKITTLPTIAKESVDRELLKKLDPKMIAMKILEAHKSRRKDK